MDTNILLVEDDRGTQELVRSILENSNYNLSCVDNGEAAINAVAKIHPHIVLLNYLLPDMVGRPPAGIGLTLLQIIKKQSPKSKVIMLTGNSTVEIAFQAGRLGAFAYVTKPFENVKLLEVLEDAIVYEKSIGQNPKSSSLISRNESLTFMEQIERDAIIQVLKETNGNIFETAKRLGIGRQTLYNKIKAYEIEV